MYLKFTTFSALFTTVSDKKIFSVLYSGQMKGGHHMAKILIAGTFIAGLIAAFFFIFMPHEMTKEDIVKSLDDKKAAYEKVGEYFRTHEELDPKYVYEQDAYKYKEIEGEIKKTLGDGFLYINVSSDHKEIVFGTTTDSGAANHKLIYSVYGAPKNEPDAQKTKHNFWYIDM